VGVVALAHEHAAEKGLPATVIVRCSGSETPPFSTMISVVNWSPKAMAPSPKMIVQYTSMPEVPAPARTGPFEVETNLTPAHLPSSPLRRTSDWPYRLASREWWATLDSNQ
jgi:hypothetical protein